MINAKNELLDELNRLPGVKIVCAEIERATLITGYSSEEYEAFLRQLDFKYDNGFGSQNLYGTVWLDNGGWLERYEYDGSEQWEMKMLPEIPLKLIRPQTIAID